MGHLVNASGFRLGNSKFWDIKAISLFRHKYFELNSFFYFLGTYLNNMFYIKKYKEYSIFYSHVVLRRVANGMNLDVYIFGSFFDIIYFNFMKSKFLQKLLGITAKQIKVTFLRKFMRFCQNFLLALLEKRLKVDLSRFGVEKINFFAYSELNLAPSVLGKIIAYKLENLYTINQIINPILKDFLLIKRVGLAINCSGRLTRKQRAHFLKFRAGSVPFSTVMNKIDYFFISVKLKYGVCGIKIWTA